MIGDFFGGGAITLGPAYVEGTQKLVNAPGGNCPRFKMADVTSPIPQDRVYFDYDYFHNAELQQPHVDVNAFTPGFEKTFLNGLVSFELRLPMAITLSNNVFTDGTTATSVGEVGNMGMAIKGLLLRRDTFALSGGLALSVPTAGNTQIFLEQGSTGPTAAIVNESVHLMPFLGAPWTPNDRLFAIGYVQVDEAGSLAAPASITRRSQAGTETEDHAAALGPVEGAVSRAAAPRREVPAAAAKHAVGTGLRPLRVVRRPVGMILLTVPVRAPLPDVPGHVV
jgi:hypothetical protein